MAGQADLNASGPDDLIPINDVARILQLRTSALRYYDERGLVRPRSRRQGRRWYGRAELRRLAFIKIAQEIGLSLTTVGAILDAPEDQWRTTVREQLVELDQLIDKARAARLFLVHALECPAERPTRDCPSMTGALELLLDGGTVEQLGRRHFPADQAVEHGPGTPGSAGTPAPIRSTERPNETTGAET